MKLSEITKREFMDTLKDPWAAEVRKRIIEYRKNVGRWKWKVATKYNKITGTFTVDVRHYSMDVYVDMVTGTNLANQVQVYRALVKVFPENEYKINSSHKAPDHMVFWIDEKDT